MGVFEKYLSLWVSVGILLGVLVGQFWKEELAILSSISVGTVNLPLAILIWGMIFPMMLQVDWTSLKNAKHFRKGLRLTVFINWMVKPFSMALLGYVFLSILFGSWLSPVEQKEYLAGSILLGVAPCTAMVFVWSYLTNGNANYTLIQVVVNDLILVFAFVPLVAILFSLFNIQLGAMNGDSIGIPFKTLLSSIILFVVFPLLLAIAVKGLYKKRGSKWVSEVLPAKLKPFSIASLLLTLVLLFAFQGEVILKKPMHILLIAIPLTIQTYLIFILTYQLGKGLKLEADQIAPSSFIGASNFFELAVAVAISLYGLNSGAALATVVGVLIEVPVMLSLVRYINRKNHKKIKEEVSI